MWPMTLEWHSSFFTFSTEEVYLLRPQHEGKDVIEYMLKEKTKMTAKLGAYSGTLEIE